jgi:hypothetical protein
LPSTVDIPQYGGTFVAGRQRRINNDPYGGEGFVWEDISVPSGEEQDVPAKTTQEAGDACLKPVCSAVADILPEQRSVATKRLDQLKRHLLDILPVKEAVEGFSLDNIHLGIGQLQDWQAPRWNCAQYTSPAPMGHHFDHEWQDYAQRVLFGPQELQPAMAYGSGHDNLIGSQWPDAPEHRMDDCDSRQTSSHGSRRRVLEVSFEPVDVHCNSWSSLRAHRRRRIAAIA